MTQGRVYHLDQEVVKASTNVVAGMIAINTQLGYVLFDPRATHSFIACKFVNKLKV
jgi:hypothetical protein